MNVRLKDDIFNIIATLSEGNPGAATVLLALADSYQNRPLIFAEAVRMFEEIPLRGTGIYMLWNDCLSRNTSLLVQLIEDWRTGCIHRDEIIQYVNEKDGRGIPMPISERRYMY